MTKPPFLGKDAVHSTTAEWELNNLQTSRTRWWALVAVIIIAAVFWLIQGGHGLTILSMIILLVIVFWKIRRLNARIAELKKTTPQSS